MIKIIAKS